MTSPCPCCGELVNVKRYKSSLRFWGKCKSCGAEFDLPLINYQDELEALTREPKTRAELQKYNRIMDNKI